MRAVQKYSPEPSSQNNNAKRKRGQDQEEGDEENDAPDVDGEEGSGAEEQDEEEGDGADDAEDSEEPTPRPKKTKSRPKASQQSSRAKKPAVKRPKTNGSAPGGVASSAVPIRLPSRTKKSVKLAVADGDDGLYSKSQNTMPPMPCLENATSGD